MYCIILHATDICHQFSLASLLASHDSHDKPKRPTFTTLLLSLKLQLPLN